MYNPIKIFGAFLLLLQAHISYAVTLGTTTPSVCWNSNSMTTQSTLFTSQGYIQDQSFSPKEIQLLKPGHITNVCS